MPDLQGVTLHSPRLGRALMQVVPQERSDAEALPSGNATSPVRFAGLVFDLSACTLVRESGEAIPLTRGEFRLLRLFVSRPGRVLSRDAILEAIANRPLELFDRSVDALVGRLRRKIEPDPKTPRLIATVARRGLSVRRTGAGAARRASRRRGGIFPQVAAEPAQTAPEVARPADPPSQTARSTVFGRQPAEEIMAQPGGRRRSRRRAVRGLRLWVAVGPRHALRGNGGGGQARQRAAAFHRRAAVREPQRRQGAGLFRRRDHRRPDDRPLASARQLRHLARHRVHI